MALVADRAVTRFLTPFILDFLTTGRMLTGSFDLGLILLLIIQANVESIVGDDAESWAYASIPVPDARRRPISANAIAEELNLPRETVRRQVATLIERGICKRVGPAGVIVPLDYLMTPELVRTQNRIVLAYLRMSVRLLDAGLSWPVERRNPARPASAGEGVPIFLVTRQVTALALRLAHVTVQLHGRLESAVLQHAVVEHNLRALDDDPSLTRRFGRLQQAAPPDALREPVTTRLLCERTGLPKATANRIIAQLIEAGDLERRGRGVICPARLFDQPDRLEVMRLAHGYFLASATRLAALGLSGDDFRRWLKAFPTEA